MNRAIELANVEIHEYCLLDLATHETIFSKNSSQDGFTGLYFRDTDNFLGIYPTKNGPVIYYRGKEYSVNPNLDISLHKNGKNRNFRISDYNIEIDYKESPYIGFDVWSDEIDVDLFYMIEQSYKDKSFYDKFTLHNM